MENNHTTDQNNSPLSEAPIRSSQNTKIKPILKSYATWRCLTSYDVHYINKYKPKMISHVHLTNLHSAMAGPRNIKGLRKALVDSKRVSSIRIEKLNTSSKELLSLFNSTNHWKNFSFPFTTIEQFSEIVSRFGRCKNLTFFPLGSQRETTPTLQGVNLEMFNLIEKQLKKLNKLESLPLDLPLYDREVFLKFNLARSLQHVHLRFQNQHGFSPLNFPKFLTNLQQKCSQLEHLSLSFPHSYEIKLQDVQVWTSFFQNAPKSLKKLTIITLFHSQQEPEELQSFFGSLKYLTNLTFLNLDCLGAIGNRYPLFYSEELLPSLFTTLQSITKLEDLKLNLNPFKSFKTAYINPLALLLESLKNLKNLDIKISFLQSPNEDFVTLSHCFRNMHHLQVLNLKIADQDLTQKSMNAFSNNIAHLNLTSLCLNRNKIFPEYSSRASFGFCTLFNFWKGSNLIPFFSNIGGFTEIEDLNLRLGNFEISPKESKCLALMLKQLNKLSSLYLNLPRFDPANDSESLRDLVSCFKDLRKMTNLALIFEQDIDDQQVRILSENLVECKSLRSLSLTFNFASQLHYNSLYCLCFGIRKIQTLETLNIDFGLCEVFNDSAVVECLYGLTALKKLSWLDFRFNSGFFPSPLPVNLKEFYKMKHLKHFVAGPSHFI